MLHSYCNNIDKFQDHYAEWNKPDITKYILYDSIYFRCKLIKNNKDPIHVCLELGVESRIDGKTQAIFWGDRNTKCVLIVVTVSWVYASVIKLYNLYVSSLLNINNSLIIILSDQIQ